LDYYPKTLPEVERVTPLIDEICNQCLIAYTPLNSALDVTYHKVELGLTGFGKPTARQRNGYYATADANNLRAPGRISPAN